MIKKLLGIVFLFILLSGNTIAKEVNLSCELSNFFVREYMG